MVVMSFTTTKAATAMIRPIKPLTRRVLAPATFLGSPELNIKSQPAIMRLAKKMRPMMTKIKFIKLKPPPVNNPPRFVTLAKLGAGLAVLIRLVMSTSLARIWFISVIFIYTNPGIPRMLIPISLIKKRDKRIKMRPITAEVMISLPALSLSGMPAEVVTMKTP